MAALVLGLGNAVPCKISQRISLSVKLSHKGASSLVPFYPLFPQCLLCLVRDAKELEQQLQLICSLANPPMPAFQQVYVLFKK